MHGTAAADSAVRRPRLLARGSADLHAELVRAPGSRLRTGLAWAEVEPGAGAEWLVWDITDTVADWASGGAENDGVLLKLVDEQENPGSAGRRCRSSSYIDPAVRPRLVVWLMT
jgi:hypothetical protein